jgi:adenosine deaminase
MAFIAKFEWMVGVLVDAEACRRVAYEYEVAAPAAGLSAEQIAQARRNAAVIAF